MLKHLHFFLASPRQLALWVALPFIGLLSACATTDAAVEPPAHWATPINKEINLYQIDTQLYRSEQPKQSDATALHELGIQTIVNLRNFHSDADIIKDNRFEFVRVPMHAWDIGDQQVIDALNAIKTAQEQGKKVLIHCQHGADRTGLVSAMYRIIYQGWSKEEALKEMLQGGYGYHSIWKNIPAYLKEANLETIKKGLVYQPSL